MDNHTPISTDRSRTYWTQAMEQYFIDLLLDHMQRGNRAGHTFNKEAWSEMVAIFNAQFGTQYDKDALKTRYTNLWKQYNDVKNLLGQSDFSWDETSQMVIADDCVWDTYLQAHSDAKSYKTKAVPNFNNLCLIYGYTSADGRYSLSSHDIDIDDDGQGQNIGSVVPPKIGWTPEMDAFFVELMLGQLEKGNKVDSTFNKKAWTDMLALFNAQFGPQHNKRILRHRYKKLWKYFGDITMLLKQSGFSWDNEQQMIRADDNAWNAYIKAHPHARSYRLKRMPKYDSLGLIYGDAISNKLQSDVSQDLGSNILRTEAGDHMARKITTSSERVRTHWTSPMDSYLIDLLLEQVRGKNKIGHTFISQAWIDMVKTFNDKFNLHLNKEVLKNRYKLMRRQYNDVKSLLEVHGFYWDETREIVSAEVHVWDTYIEEHPEARPYRVKAISNFDKLCVIFEAEGINVKYSCEAHNVPNEETSTMMIGSGRDDWQQDGVSDYLMMEWTHTMESYFINLLLEQIRGGNNIDGAVNNQAWADMVAACNEIFCFEVDKNALEDYYLLLKKQHRDISSLLHHKGFALDEVQQVIVADNEAWEAYLKEHPEAVSYRGKILANYNKLCDIFGRKGVSCDQNVGEEIGNNSPGPGFVQALPNEASILYSKIKKRGTDTSCDSRRSSKVQKTGKSTVQETLNKMHGIAAAFENKKLDQSALPIENAIDALQAIPDIGNELLLDACDLLEDDRKAKTFLALDASLRKKWLLRKLRP